VPTLAELPGFFRLQAKSCASAPLYVSLFEALAQLAESDGPAFERLLAAWRGRSFGTFYGATLLLAASLHRAYLEGDSAIEPLSAHFEGASTLDAAPPPSELVGPTGRVLRAPSARMVDFWRTGTVQTNEVSRSIAWRLVADLVAARGAGSPTSMVLVELGCSAGLNLVQDDLGLRWEGWRPRASAAGRSPSIAASRIVAALGIDRSPLDVSVEEDRLLLRASLWPGQVERRARLDAAIEALEREKRAGFISIERGDLPGAVDRVASFTDRHPGAFVLVFNTIVTGYLDDTAYRELQTRIASLLSRRRGVWVELETPRGQPDRADRAELAVWSPRDGSGSPPGIERVLLAETEPHPRVLRVVEGAVEELEARLRA
jgi:hypothetical protein